VPVSAMRLRISSAPPAGKITEVRGDCGTMGPVARGDRAPRREFRLCRPRPSFGDDCPVDQPDDCFDLRLFASFFLARLLGLTLSHLAQCDSVRILRL
jgi:hypothetical protein